MSFSLVSNLSSISSQAKLSSTSSMLNKTVQRLSSGLRINQSGDDAAGLAIANGYRSDVAQIRQGIRNANDGVSTMQIIDGGLNTISNLLDRAAVLATQAASGTTTSASRTTLNDELTKVMSEIDRQAQNIGLASSGANESRFASEISVFIGGGTSATAANNKVTVNLSGSAVDTTGLTLTGLDLTTAQAGSVVTGSSALPANLTVSDTLQFTVDGANFSVDFEAGDSRAAVVAKLNSNADMQAAGIRASLGSSNELILTPGNKDFSVLSTAWGGASELGVNGMSAAVGSATYGAEQALSAIKSAISTLGQVQGVVGAGQNNLAQAIDLATSQLTNFQAAESRIRDADVAQEASDLARLSTLQQAGVAALAQANQASQAVLSLLR